MIALKILSKILKALASQASPNQLAWGFVLGMFLGLSPFWGLYPLLAVLLIIILRVNISMAFVGWLVFELLAFLLDPLLHSMGYWLLVDVTVLQTLWVSLSNSPVLAWLNFTNTVVLGSFVFGLVLILPMFFAMKKFVITYREKWHDKLMKTKIVQILKGTKIYGLVEKAMKLGE